MDTVMRLLVRLASLQAGVFFRAEHSWQGGWIHSASPVWRAASL